MCALWCGKHDTLHDCLESTLKCKIPEFFKPRLITVNYDEINNRKAYSVNGPRTAVVTKAQCVRQYTAAGEPITPRYSKGSSR